MAPVAASTWNHVSPHIDRYTGAPGITDEYG
jgi:hypothetical protein